MAVLQAINLVATHRLIPARFADGTALERLSLPASTLADLRQLSSATHPQVLAESGRNPHIGPHELLSGVPNASIVNAAFTHSGPFGGRFNSPGRGAWYAAVHLETSLREVAFHKRRFLLDSRIPPASLTFDYTCFLADFSGHYHHLEPEEQPSCLQPGPIPACYGPSQTLARFLLFSGSCGIVYPSVRHPSGTCIACFRPALVAHPRPADSYHLTLPANQADEFRAEQIN